MDLLQKYLKFNINSAPFLATVVKNMTQKSTEIENFGKCLEILLANQSIDINKMDSTNQSALHYAVKSNNSDVILKLLERGAYIGVKNEVNHFSISHINPKLLETHFDSCITTNGLLMNDNNFEIQFNFKNLIQSQNSNNRNQADEMTIVEFISKSKNLKQLMIHPLISGFLSLKWNRLAPFFYINFLFCTFFSAVTIAYILVFYNYDRGHNANSIECYNGSIAENQANDVSFIFRSN